jgi:hypothetical protein
MARRPRARFRVPRSEPDRHCSKQARAMKQLLDGTKDGTMREKRQASLDTSEGAKVANKKPAGACRAKSPSAEECALRRGHRGSHSWWWMRKLNEPIKKLSHSGTRRCGEKWRTRNGTESRRGEPACTSKKGKLLNKNHAVNAIGVPEQDAQSLEGLSRPVKFQPPTNRQLNEPTQSHSQEKL